MFGETTNKHLYKTELLRHIRNVPGLADSDSHASLEGISRDLDNFLPQALRHGTKVRGRNLPLLTILFGLFEDVGIRKTEFLEIVRLSIGMSLIFRMVPPKRGYAHGRITYNEDSAKLSVFWQLSHIAVPLSRCVGQSLFSVSSSLSIHLTLFSRTVPRFESVWVGQWDKTKDTEFCHCVSR